MPIKTGTDPHNQTARRVRSSASFSMHPRSEANKPGLSLSQQPKQPLCPPCLCGEEKGAALIVAIGVLTILLAISITFFQISREQLRSATNVSNRVKADFLVDGAFATAIAFLNHDLRQHPNYTSLDHAWRTYFNGAWAAGKPWMWAGWDPNWQNDNFDNDGDGFIDEPNEGSFLDSNNPLAPEVNLLTAGLRDDFGNFDPALPSMFRASRKHDWLYIPRIDPALDGTTPTFFPRFAAPFPLLDPVQLATLTPFAIDEEPLLTNNVSLQEINPNDAVPRWPDFTVVPQAMNDNQAPTGHPTGMTTAGDLVSDIVGNVNQPGFVLSRAMQVHAWADVDNDGDGLNDSIWLPVAADLFLDADGLDNNLNWTIWRDDDEDGLANEEPGQGIDNIDNDGDGIADEPDEGIDEPGEPALFVYRALVNANGQPMGQPLNQTQQQLDDQFGVGNHAIFRTVQFPFANVDLQFIPLNRNQLPGSLPIDRAGTRLADAIPDQIDNDYSLLVDDGLDAVHLVPPALRTTLFNAAQVARIYAEPATELVGRMAILINDEASKVNLNAAGANTLNPFPGQGDAAYTPPGGLPLAVTRALADGATTAEYATEVLPGIGPALRQRIDQFRNGAPNGFGGLPLDSRGFGNVSAAEDAIMDDFFNQGYLFDITFPGFGRVDDNGMALALALDGIDNNGNQLLDEGIRPVFDSDGFELPLFGLLEGIDEPGEYRTLRPHRHRLAELDGLDNEPDDVVDEIGELGDRVFRTTEQLKLINGIGEETFNDLRRFISTDATAKNQRRLISRPARGAINGPTDGVTSALLPQFQATTGVKLDYNYALAEDIARAFRADRDYQANHYLWVDFSFPRDGIRETLLDTEIPRMLPYIEIDPNQNVPNHPVSGDAFQFARGLRLNGLHYRLPEGSGGILEDAGGGLAYDEDDVNNTVALRADDELRAMQLAANARDYADPNFARSEIKTHSPDRWWTDVVGGDPRNIEYTAAGVEAIRINEIMVRPVRRVEAEMDRAGANFDPAPIVGMPEFAPLHPLFGRPITFQDVPPPGGGTTGWQPFDDQEVIGSRAGLKATLTQLNGNPPFPDIIEFVFRVSDGLPEGRYYLLVNTVNENGQATLTDDGQLRFSIKYTDPAGPSILEDTIVAIQANDPNFFTDKWHPVDQQLVGLTQNADETLAEITGQVFLPNVRKSVAAQIEGYFQFGGAMDHTVTPPENFDGEGFTVRVEEGRELHVALHVQDLLGVPSNELAINFFDFSQEPMHEWVELANVSTSPEPVDISGWHLTVDAGIGLDGLPSNQDIEGRVPNGTFIAPGGRLLLGVNKYDEFIAQRVGANDGNPDFPLVHPRQIIFNNGIGLARGPIQSGGSADSPIPSVDPDGIISISDVFNSVTVPPIPSVTLGQTPFRPGAEDVFGISPGDTAVVSTREIVKFHNEVDPDKPFDRIVELEFTRPALNQVTNLNDLAKLLLRGGVFPNSPEFDGVDNDSDIAFLGDDGVIYPSADATLQGIDEGRGFYAPDVVRPGGFSRANVPFNYNVGAGLETEQLIYMGDFNNSPDWKEFVERRTYPGDNVIVTLYQGPPEDRRIVDRITYTQRDVENRAIDDIVRNPYILPDGSAVTLDGIVLTDGSPSSLWPDNSMAFDFYRSLERRHPLYIGDRFGTRNRWQAADGNYDDWAPNVSRFTLDSAGNAIARTNVAFAPYTSASPLQANFQAQFIDAAAFSLGHDVFGIQLTGVRNSALVSPGDMLNLSAFSYTLELGDPWGFGNSAQTIQGNLFNLLSDDVVELKDPDEFPEVFPDGGVRFIDVSDTNVATVLPGDVPPASVIGEIGGQPIGPVRAHAEDLATVVDSAATDPVTLTVAQADFIPLVPSTNNPQGIPLNVADALGWGTTQSPNVPEAWTPVYLFEFPGFDELWEYGDTGFTQPNVNPSDSDENIPAIFRFDRFFSNPFTSAGMSAEELALRWPQDQRIAMYVSGNDPDVLNNPDVGADAAFVWGPDDGLENGEYELFIVARDPWERLLPQAANFTDFAAQLFDGSEKFAEQKNTQIFRINAYSDRNGNGRLDDLEPLQSADSFGWQVGVPMDADGVARYGFVRVTNNQLAIRLQNTTPSGISSFTRVVLAPRNRTPGRININTAVSQHVEPREPDSRVFNPLMGVPGVLLRNAFDFDSYPGDIAPPEQADIFLHLNDVPGINPFVEDYLTTTPQLGRRINGATFFRSRQITRFRPDHADGRYYQFTADLVRDRSNGNVNEQLVKPFLPGLITNAIEPTSAADQYRAIAERFTRMSNLITTRSDVFEILVTVQAGYGVDENGDGRINYRGQEFVAVSEQSARMVYER